MPFKTSFIPGFHYLCGRAKKPEATRLKEQLEHSQALTPGQLQSVFGKIITVLNVGRKRVFDRGTTFWAFLGQILNGGTCRSAVREVQAQRHKKGLPAISSSTSAYCQARGRLGLAWLEELAGESVRHLEHNKDSQWDWRGRRVLYVDGTSCQLPDTEENQEAYPQHSSQQEGCGQPLMQLVGLFEMGAGALLKASRSPWYANESGMFGVDLVGELRAGDVLGGDMGFGSFLNIALVQGQGADAVFRISRSRKYKFPGGKDDMVVTWQRPGNSARPLHYTQEEWERLPRELTVRLVRIRVQKDGFRLEEIVLATTLMDAPIEELAMLYFRRWEIEVCFRDIKTALGMDELEGKTPGMAKKEVTMYLLAYNLLRALMVETARLSNQPLKVMSFTGTRDTVRHWAGIIASASSQKKRDEAMMEMFACIAKDSLVIREGRQEPREVKRRPKSFKRMTEPRKGRTRKAAKQRKEVLS